MDEENPFEPLVQKDLRLAEGTFRDMKEGCFTITVRDEAGNEWSSKTHANGSLIIILEEEGGKRLAIARSHPLDILESGSSLSKQGRKALMKSMLEFFGD